MVDFKVLELQSQPTQDVFNLGTLSAVALGVKEDWVVLYLLLDELIEGA